MLNNPVLNNVCFSSIPRCSVTCSSIISRGYCSAIQTVVLTDEELAEPEIIRGIRTTAYTMRFLASEWPDRLIDMRRDYKGVFVDETGCELIPNLELFFEESYVREWFRDKVCTPIPPAVRPRCTDQSREKYRSLGTILKAKLPAIAAGWCLTAANDNQNCE